MSKRKSWKLFLDDVREVDQVYLTSDIDRFKVARSYDEAVSLVREYGCPEFISFDHDLGWNVEKTGKNFANWLVYQDMEADGKFFPENFSYKIHSANPVGAENIQKYLESYLKSKGSLS